ncbi:DinB family protein [Pedobacter alpinus]|uniref:DinB family protein n=1 Tax=Pedobacter alpinus TaxID=1590643 RepID=A0ABW5TMM3_9SPHI
MSVKSDQNNILQSLKFYSSFLKTVNEEVFLKTPQQGEWSYSEVYAHIFSAHILSVIAIEKCLNKTAELKIRKPDWRVRLILFFGRFPPVKYKVPAVLADAVKKISKEDAANQLVKLQKRIEDIHVGFSKFNPHYKVKHPRLGYLDAKAWLRFILVHSKHHQRQIKRIEKMLQTI